MIKVACSGFPVGQKKYQSKLKTVELGGLFDAFPRISTLEKWGEAAKTDFEYIVCASKLITHPAKKTAAASHAPRTHRIGYFQDSPEVRQAFQRTWQAAEILRSRIVLFRCPSQLTPHPDHVQRVQNFFKGAARGNKHFVWEPPSSWPASLIDNVGRSLYLTSAANPLSRHYKPSNAPMRYFRIGADGKTSGIHSYSDSELRDIKAACDKPLSYVVFNNGPTSFFDAIRFFSLVHA